MAKEYSLGNPLVLAGWVQAGEEIPHWGMAILGWLSKYNAILTDSTSKAHESYHILVRKALEKRTPQAIHTIYEAWGKSLK